MSVTFDTAICNKALKLLRQDIEISGSSGNSIAVKCGSIYELSYIAVANAHTWTTPMTGTSNVTDMQKRLLVYALARDLALPITGRQSDYEMLSTQFNKELALAIKKDIEDKIVSENADPILAQLIPNMIGDVDKLPTTYSIFTKRRDAVKTNSDNAVKATLGLSANATLDGIALEAATVLAVSRLASVCGLDANISQLKMAEYEKLIMQWRKLAIDNAMKTDSDPVLVFVLSNMAGDSSKLVNAYDTYTHRATAAKNLAEKEIQNEHNWATAFTQTGITHSAYPAFIYCAAVKLIGPCGGDANIIQLTEQKYRNALQTAISKDLEVEMTTLRSQTDNDSKFAVQVLDTMRQYYSVADSDLGNGRPKPQPRGIAVLKTHINSVKDKIRKEILYTHDWSFAKKEIRTNSTRLDDGRFRTEYPGDADRIIKCFDELGNKVDTVLREGHYIYSEYPIYRIVYLYDDGTTDEWTPLVKNAFINKIAEAVSIANPELFGNAKKIGMFSQTAEKMLSEAKQADSRQSGGGSSAYGRNYLYDVATGRRQVKAINGKISI